MQAFVYGATNARIFDYDYGTNYLKVFATLGGTTLSEYTEAVAGSPTWTKSYVYLNDQLLSTVTPNGLNNEFTEYSHPDRLGTRMITNQQVGTNYEQTTLPFGTALNAESTANTNNRFTSYDRSEATKLDYAVNRTYDSKQGRFTQVDPIEMHSVSLSVPQTLNLYSYCGNDPINHTDPDGLFWGAIGKFFKKAFKWIAVAVSVAIAVLTIAYAPVLFTTTLKLIFGIIGAVANAASSVLNAFGQTKLGAMFGFISAVASFGTSYLGARSALSWKTFLAAASSAATLANRTLTLLGHQKLGQIFGLVATVTGFISDGIKPNINKETKIQNGFKWDSSMWRIYKFARSTAEQTANLAGKSRLAGYFNVLGIVDDAGDSYLGYKNFKKDIDGGAEVFELDVLKNTRRTLTGLEELGARILILQVNVLKRSNEQIGRNNNVIRRVERGIALAR